MLNRFTTRFFGRPHSIARIYAFSAVATLAAVVAVGLNMGAAALLTVVTLIALEITFSFDNAVVNAKILAKMPAFWRRMFMTVGIFIAVFGMRLALPIVLVAVTAGLDIFGVVHLAVADPIAYADHLHAAHPLISAFGGMFLLMIFLEFMLDEKREIHWIHVLERPLARAGQLTQLAVILALITLLIVAELFGGQHKLVVITAGLVGMLTHLVINALATVFERKQRPGANPVSDWHSHQHIMRAGFFNFMYLEVLDASFSFDGVIGAFAITKMVLLIAIGLGVGAMWVRSMTVHLVRRHTLNKYRYLDHGAHYAIGALSAMLLAGISFEIPEYITGTLGIGIIGLSFLSSWHYNATHRKKQPHHQAGQLPA